MGSKNYAIKTDDYLKLAKKSLIEEGFIEGCQICGYYYALVDLCDNVYAKATQNIKSNYDIKDFDYKLFHECIKMIFDESGIETISEHMDIVHK